MSWLSVPYGTCKFSTSESNILPFQIIHPVPPPLECAILGVLMRLLWLDCLLIWTPGLLANTNSFIHLSFTTRCEEYCGCPVLFELIEMAREFLTKRNVPVVRWEQLIVSCLGRILYEWHSNIDRSLMLSWSGVSSACSAFKNWMRSQRQNVFTSFISIALADT